MSQERAFLALVLPESVRENLGEIRGKWPHPQWDIKWVHPAQIHITIHFFGPLSDRAEQGLRQVLPGYLRSLQPFSFTLGGLGAFPPGKKPKVLWAGVEQGRQPMVQLHEQVQQAIRETGLEPESRSFHPHATVGRVRRAGPGSFDEAAAMFEGKSFGAVEARELVLFASQLGKGGPVYTPLERFPLGQGD